MIDADRRPKPAAPRRAAAPAAAQRRAAAPPTADANGRAARDAILGAARAEFAAKGLTGARVNEIATRAGVNKQLIYYYFGSKDDLYRTALEVVYAEIRTLERSLKLDDLPPEHAMASLVGFSFDYLAQHPDFIGLLNHENARGAHHVNTSPALRETNSPLIELIGATLRRGVRSKVFRRGIDPVELYISLASIFNRDLRDEKTVAAYRRHVVTLLMAGLRP